MAIQCWRWFGTRLNNSHGEVFACTDQPGWINSPFDSGGYAAFPAIYGEIFDVGGSSFIGGTEQLTISVSDEHVFGYNSYGNCVGCLSVRHDCINSECVPQTHYGTPGLYASLTDCQAVCGGEEEVKFTSISVPVFSQCDPITGAPVKVNQQVSVIQGTESLELLKFQQIADIEGFISCSLNPTLSVPDSWLIRPEHGRPQVIYQYAEVNSSGVIIGPPKYQINVPHHTLDKPSQPLPNYQKGDWQTILVLKDNSKVTLFTLDQANADLMLVAIKARINTDYLVGSYLSRSCPVVGLRPMPPIFVKNRMVKCYSQGAFNVLPDWIVKF